MKRFTVQAKFRGTIKLTVYAENEEDARKRLENAEEDDIEVVDEDDTDFKWNTLKEAGR